MINFAIRKTLIELEADPNAQLQYLQDVINECQYQATNIQNKHQISWVEVVNEPVQEEPLTEEENNESICE